MILGLLILITAFVQASPPTLVQEGATGSSSSSVTGVNPSGNVYTMVNTVTEPDGTIVTDTLDTEGNYVTTVYTSNTMNANPPSAQPAADTNKQHSYTEIKQPRVVFQE